MAGKTDATYPVSILRSLYISNLISTKKTNFCMFNIGKSREMGECAQKYV